MEKIKGDAIKALAAVLIGLCVIFILKEFMLGLLLIVVGAVISGLNENLRNILVSFIKLLWDKMTGKEHTQRMENSPRGVQQQVRSSGDSYIAGRDLIIKKQR